MQRFDSALRLNVHLHGLALDGMYLREAGGVLGFHQLPEPSADKVVEVAERTDSRLRYEFKKAWKDGTRAVVRQGTLKCFSLSNGAR